MYENLTNDYSLELMIKTYLERLSVLEDDYRQAEDCLIEKEKRINNLRKLIFILKRGDKICQQ